MYKYLYPELTAMSSGIQERMWAPDVEAMSRDEIEEQQERDLLAQFEHFHQHSEFYNEKFSKHDVSVTEVESVRDFQATVPVTRKDDIREQLIANPRTLGGIVTDPADLVQYFSSTGTTGKPTFYASDREGFDAVKECMARVFTAVGATNEDLIQVCTGGHHLILNAAVEAAREVGQQGLGVQAHVEEIDRFVHHLKNLKPDYTYHAQLIWQMTKEHLEEEGLQPSDVPIHNVITSGEVQVPGRTKWIEEEWGTNNYDIYGFGEIPHPWVMTWCTNGMEGQRRGYHVHEDFVFVEVIDPETEEPLPIGERGEITVTNLVDNTAAGIRWGTEDIGYLEGGTCECGRTHRRLHVLGRDNYEVIVEGTSIFPSEVEEELWNVEGVPKPPTFQVVKRGTEMEQLEVDLADTGPDMLDRVHDRLQSALDVPVTVSELNTEDMDTAAYKQSVIREE